eukprot:TRINITY_DN63524_c0_g1_i1.p1 TRINITY_DN63524_c0_g1~~TRINITY_DN63524_c0_g1_i1.p1  ORF type:complete len:602 (-),score=93.78 TRINITY_DN63524_c0_g1_i1:209-1777(-)
MTTPHDLYVEREMEGITKNWLIKGNSQSSKPQKYVVALACPKGCPTALGWRRAADGRDIDVWEEDCLDGIQSQSGRLTNLNSWMLHSILGQGHQGAIVFLASWKGIAGMSAEAGGQGCAAVKYPIELEELSCHSLVQDLAGVATILDFGLCPRGQLYMAMPVVSPSLDEVLRGRCDHDGLGGRIAWPAAAGLGARLLHILRSIRERGVLHCDIKPGNLLLPFGDPWIQLIDFGRSGLDGDISFEPGHGGMRDYMSIKANLVGGCRSAADDLEMLGWLLLRCIIGGFPWRAKEKPHPDETWIEGSQRVAHEKIRFLDPLRGPKSFATKGFCPPALMDYLRSVRSLGDVDWKDIDYEMLCKPFRDISEERAQRSEGGHFYRCAWQRFCEGTLLEVSNPLRLVLGDAGKRSPWDWPAVAETTGRDIFWRPAPEDLDTKSSLEKWAGMTLVQSSVKMQGSLLRLSGRYLKETKEGFTRWWVEVDPVWMPDHERLEFLSQANWILAMGNAKALGGSSGPWLRPVSRG